jgi:hypothetical protein
MKDGDVLKQFIDNQPKSKISVAKALGMSRQNLFGLFKSATLSQETKDKFEGYFGKAIFTERQDDVKIISEYRTQKSGPDVEPLFDVTMLQRSIYNLTENELRTTGIIERLVNILERVSLQPSGSTPPTFSDPGINDVGSEGFSQAKKSEDKTKRSGK